MNETLSLPYLLVMDDDLNEAGGARAHASPPRGDGKLCSRGGVFVMVCLYAGDRVTACKLVSVGIR